MAEYVEREAALREIERREALMVGDKCISVDAMKSFIKNRPAADVASVVHGRWEPAESDFDDDDTLFDVEDWCDWQCSACHEDICYDDPMERRWLPKYCPNCGAKMDGGGESAQD